MSTLYSRTIVIVTLIYVVTVVVAVSAPSKTDEGYILQASLPVLSKGESIGIIRLKEKRDRDVVYKKPILELKCGDRDQRLKGQTHRSNWTYFSLPKSATAKCSLNELVSGDSLRLDQTAVHTETLPSIQTKGSAEATPFWVVGGVCPGAGSCEIRNIHDEIVKRFDPTPLQPFDWKENGHRYEIPVVLSLPVMTATRSQKGIELYSTDHGRNYFADVYVHANQATFLTSSTALSGDENVIDLPTRFLHAEVSLEVRNHNPFARNALVFRWRGKSPIEATEKRVRVLRTKTISTARDLPKWVGQIRILSAVAIGILVFLSLSREARKRYRYKASAAAPTPRIEQSLRGWILSKDNVTSLLVALCLTLLLLFLGHLAEFRTWN